MSFKMYKLTPVDTLFFRDGRPYNQGESSSTDVKSLFPPFAVTMVGALRASLSRGLGWNGKGNWSSEIKKKLGDGQDLGPMKFKGPYLIKGQEVLFPAPLNLLGKVSETEKGKWSQLNLLHPGEEVDCDIGDKVRLPALKNAIGMKSLDGYYLTSWDLGVVLEGGDPSKVYVFNWNRIPGKDDGRLREFLMNKFSFEWAKTALIGKSSNGKTIKISTGEKSLLLELDDKKTKVTLEIDGSIIEEFTVMIENGELNIYSKVNPIKGSDLWDFEYLVGIQRNFETRTTEEGLMYSRSRVRLSSGVGLAVGIEGLADGMELLSPLPFGGDGGLAYADPINISIKIPDAPNLEASSDGKIQFTVTHLTPAYFEGKWPGPGDELPGISGSQVVSACLERPVRIGGWDSVKREPLPLKPFLPGGSIWFCEAHKDNAEKIRQCNGQHLGKYSEYGFGEIAIGQWINEN